MRVRVLAAAVAAVGVLCAACGGGGSGATPASRREPVPAVVSLPEQLLGLKIVSEDISEKLKPVRNTYFDSVGLVSFRETDDLLRATLQVSRFNDQAESDDAGFRRRIISNLGSIPEELRVGDDQVFLSTGNEQLVFSWFEGDGFFVLSVRNDYAFPRTLLRRLIEMDLSP